MISFALAPFGEDDEDEKREKGERQVNLLSSARVNKREMAEAMKKMRMQTSSESATCWQSMIAIANDKQQQQLLSYPRPLDHRHNKEGGKLINRLHHTSPKTKTTRTSTTTDKWPAPLVCGPRKQTSIWKSISLPVLFACSGHLFGLTLKAFSRSFLMQMLTVCGCATRIALSHAFQRPPLWLFRSIITLRRLS